MVQGEHTFKAGGVYPARHYNGFGRQCIAGCVTFDFKNTGRPRRYQLRHRGRQSARVPAAGLRHGGSIDTIRFIGQQWSSFSGYVQDDWRVRRS